MDGNENDPNCLKTAQTNILDLLLFDATFVNGPSLTPVTKGLAAAGYIWCDGAGQVWNTSR